MEKLRFLTIEHINFIKDNYQLPVFVYSENEFRKQANECLNFPNAFGLTVRYAMKANSNKNILKIFDSMGLHIDASSSFEAYRAIQAANIDPKKIQLTTQEFADDLNNLLNLGVTYNATSLHQLTEYGKNHPNTNLSIRINPGIGSGGTKRTSTGGISSSFGIWHEYIDQVYNIINQYNLKITKLHTHIGSGSDPDIWTKVADISLSLVNKFPDVQMLNLGGGFKIDRMNDQNNVDMQKVGQYVSQSFQNFADKTGRKIHLEIEPGTYLAANAGCLLGIIEDISDTGDGNFTFLKTNIGMPDILRPAMYGAQHPIHVINDDNQKKDYVVVGPCCESGDILTPVEGNPELISTRTLSKAKIGDIIVVEGAGAYCSSMSVRNYNSYPAIAELLIQDNGDIKLIKQAEHLPELWRHEI